MIQVYLPNNTDFTHNGDMVLTPEQAEVTCEINGAWEAVLVHPIDENGRWEALIDGAVVKMPSWNGEQLFRIRVKDKSDLAGVTCQMDPIFFDAANDCFLEDVRPTSKTGQQALDIMTAANTKYTGESNISKVSTAYYEFKNLLEAISGSDDNSFLNRWGGEIEYDNFTVKINTRLGSDKNIEYRYGKNIEGVTETVDMSEVVTRIYPKAFNGRTLSGTKYVDSPLIGSYPTVKSRVMVFDNIKLAEDVQATDSTNPNLTICNTQAELDTALRQACVYQWDAGIDKPLVTIQIEGVVPNMTEFSGADLELGDTVYLRHPVLDIMTESRVVALTYDAIRKEVISITLGSVAYNYFNSVSSAVTRIETAVRPDGSVRADAVKGVIDMGQAKLYAQYDAATRQDVLGMLFENNDSTSELYGAMAIGTQGFMISKTKDEDGNWIWSTFGTAAGFNASMLVVGTILANLIKGGTLTLGGDDNENGLMQVLDADGNLIGKWDNTGATITGRLINTYGAEWLQMYQSVLSGGSVTGTTDGTLDLSANATDSHIYTVLRALTGELILASNNQHVQTEAGTYIQDTAATYILQRAGTSHFRSALNGNIQDTATANIIRTANNNIQDTASNNIFRTASNAINDSATNYMWLSSGANQDCYVTIANDSNGRNIDLHANTSDFIKIDATNDKIDTWASDFTYQGATLSIMLRVNAFSSLPKTITDSRITTYHYVAKYYLTNPSAQTSDWTITTAAGSLTISGSISGSTGIHLLLVKPIHDIVTS